MKYSRRAFLRTGTAAVAGTAIVSASVLAAKKQKGIIALQLYSIRDDMMKDPRGSLAQVATMGYRYVEHANYVDRKFYGYPAHEFKKILDDLGLTMISGHTVMGMQHWDEANNDFSDSWKKTVDDAAVLGQRYVVSPWMDTAMRTTYDRLKRSMEVFNKCGELCRARGMKFGYHNHDFEFSETLNGERIFDIIMKSIDPDNVALQLDIGNMYNGGAAALEIVRQYPGRFELIHVKDEIRSSENNGRYVSTVLGDGIVHARDVIRLAAQQGGARIFVIEQEDYQHRTPMESVQLDLRSMRRWGY